MIEQKEVNQQAGRVYYYRKRKEHIKWMTEECDRQLAEEEADLEILREEHRRQKEAASKAEKPDSLRHYFH